MEGNSVKVPLGRRSPAVATVVGVVARRKLKLLRVMEIVPGATRRKGGNQTATSAIATRTWLRLPAATCEPTSLADEGDDERLLMAHVVALLVSRRLHLRHLAAAIALTRRSSSSSQRCSRTFSRRNKPTAASGISTPEQQTT